MSLIARKPVFGVSVYAKIRFSHDATQGVVLIRLKVLCLFDFLETWRAISHCWNMGDGKTFKLH